MFISRTQLRHSYQDGLGRTTQTLDHVVGVHISIWDKRKSQINEYRNTVRRMDKSAPLHCEAHRGGVTVTRIPVDLGSEKLNLSWKRPMPNGSPASPGCKSMFSRVVESLCQRRGCLEAAPSVLPVRKPSLHQNLINHHRLPCILPCVTTNS